MTMSLEQIPWVLVLGVSSSLIAAGVLWFLRRQVIEIASGLDMSAGGLLAWIMAFSLMIVMVVFAIYRIEIPIPLTLGGVVKVRVR